MCKRRQRKVGNLVFIRFISGTQEEEGEGAAETEEEEEEVEEELIRFVELLFKVWK